MSDAVLTLNAGSSGINLALFAPGREEAVMDRESRALPTKTG